MSHTASINNSNAVIDENKEIENYDMCLINAIDEELSENDTTSSSSIVHLELEKEDNTENEEDISDDRHDDILKLETLKNYELHSTEFKTMIPVINDESKEEATTDMESLKLKDEDNLFTLQDQGNSDVENKELSGKHSIESNKESTLESDKDNNTLLERNISDNCLTENSESFNIVTENDCRLSLKTNLENNGINDSGDSIRSDKITVVETDNLKSLNESNKVSYINNVDEDLKPAFDNDIDLKNFVVNKEKSSQIVERTDTELDNTFSSVGTSGHILKNTVDYDIVSEFSKTNITEVVENQNNDRVEESNKDIIIRNIIDLDNTISLMDINENLQDEEVNEMVNMITGIDQGYMIKSREDNVIIEHTSFKRDEGKSTDELQPLQISESGIREDKFESGLSHTIDNYITENDVRIQTIEIKDDQLYSLPSPSKDETDFRVNIIERDDTRDSWVPNLYVHNDNVEEEVPQNRPREPNIQEIEIVDVTDSPATLRPNLPQGTGHISEEVEISQCNDIVEHPVVLKPIGVGSLAIFNSLNSIMVMLFSCTEFRRKMIEYHQSDAIAYFDFDSQPGLTPQDGLLINDMCKLFTLMLEENEIKTCEIARKIRQYFKDQTNTFNLYTGFNYLLNKTNTITKKVENETKTSKDEGEIEYFNFKIQNNGFVFDLFYGQMLERIFCEKCHTVHSTQYHPMNSLSLKIPKNRTSVNLDDCIKDFLSASKLKSTNDYTCCDNPVINSLREITHAPKYFFIYIDRQADKGVHDQTYVDADNGVIIAKKDGFVLYSLYSVIDQIQTNQLSRHVTKCLSDLWWLIDDRNVKRIEEYELISEYTVGLMLKKQDDF